MLLPSEHPVLSSPLMSNSPDPHTNHSLSRDAIVVPYTDRHRGLLISITSRAILGDRLFRNVMQVRTQQLDTLNVVPSIQLLVDTVRRISATSHRQQ